MRIILRLALRNLKEHKAKSIIIALFILFGSAIVILGNSFLEAVNRGLERDFRANYTGDIVINEIPPKGITVDIISANSTTFTGELPQIPAITQLDDIMSIVKSTDEIESDTKLISAMALMTKGEEFEVNTDDTDDLSLSDLPVFILFAGEKDTYFNTFDGQHILEGAYPAPGTNELLVDTRVRSALEKFYKITINVGDNVLVAGANTNGVVREGKICGFFKPTNENSAMFQIVYCTPDFARAFANLTYGATFAQDLPDSVDMSLSSMEEDDLFGSSDDDEFWDIVDEDADVLSSSEINYFDILGDTTLRDELNKTDDGAWNFIILKTKHKGETDSTIAKLNEQFKEKNINAVAVNWKTAALSYTQSVEGIGILFNALIIILAIVVFIIIMNTMTISAIERTNEIGTMRALGAEKGFVRNLFYSESFIITVLASVAGSVLAVIIATIINGLNITISNSIAKMILGGGQIQFIITPAIVIATIAIATLGSIISTIYPVSSALKITPLKALSKGGE